MHHSSASVLSLKRDKQQRQPPSKCYYNHGKNGKSRVNNNISKSSNNKYSSSSCNTTIWLLKCLLIQLLCISISKAQTAIAATPSNIAAAPVIKTSSRETTPLPTAEGTVETFMDQQKPSVSKRSQQSSFTTLDKEVGTADIILNLITNVFFLILCI